MAANDTVPTTTAPLLEGLDATPQEQLEFKRRIFATADRSYINDALNVKLPPDVYGEWIGCDNFSQFNARQLGFVDGESYLSEFNKIHHKADGTTVGDVKFMVMPMWKYKAMEEANRIRSMKSSGIESDAGNKEVQAYAASLGLGIEKDRSVGRVISGSELENLIK